jgi:hypothetical protein
MSKAKRHEDNAGCKDVMFLQHDVWIYKYDVALGHRSVHSGRILKNSFVNAVKPNDAKRIIEIDAKTSNLTNVELI